MWHKLNELVSLPFSIWHECWHFLPALVLGYRPTFTIHQVQVRSTTKAAGWRACVVILAPSAAGLCVSAWLMWQYIQTGAPWLPVIIAASLVLLQYQCLYDFKDFAYVCRHRKWRKRGKPGQRRRR